MRKRQGELAIVALLLVECTACSQGKPEKGAVGEVATFTPDNDEPYFCGGETTRSQVDRFFADLHEALASGSPLSRFDRFVAGSFQVVEHGKATTFDRNDFNSITPRFVTLADWEEMRKRKTANLQGAGYRGCFFDNGKAWFVASPDQGLRVAGINKDMPWLKQ